jgi:23S rRNA pseudouridine1911/1915/1917 synthase
MELDIIYEDDAILSINKSAGIATHPSRMHFDNTLSNGVKFYFDSIGLNKKIRPVNRLDLNTSGIVIFAKNEYVQENLIRQMSLGELKKEYLVVADGKFEDKVGHLEDYLVKNERNNLSKVVQEGTKNSKLAILDYEVIKYNEEINLSVVKIKLHTGRHHQIRVQLSNIGNPVVGDKKYKSRNNPLGRLALHATKLEVIHPVTKKLMVFESKVPSSFEKMLEI